MPGWEQAAAAVIGGLFTKKPKVDPNTQASADFTRYQMGQAQQAGQYVPSLYGIEAGRAGLLFDPGSPGTPGTPGTDVMVPYLAGHGFGTIHKAGTPATPGTGGSFKLDPNWSPFASDEWKNLDAQQSAMQAATARRLAPANAAAGLSGVHGPGHSTEALQRGMAYQRAGFARSYFDQATQQRQANIDKFVSIILNTANGGQGAAALSNQIGQQNTARNDAQAAQQEEAFANAVYGLLQKNNASPYAPTLPAGMPYNPNDPYGWSGGAPIHDPLAVDDPLEPKWGARGALGG
jgi:hypothetical protein